MRAPPGLLSETAKPGLHKGAVELVPEKGPKKRIAVTIEVFEFQLPAAPSLKTSFPLNRKATRTTYGIEDIPLEPWKPIYDALSDHRIAYALWHDGALVKVAPDGTAAAEAFKEHLAYAVEASNMSAIDIGNGEDGIAPFPAPEAGNLQDPLQLYLFDMAAWLQARDWLDRAFLQVMPAPSRTEWAEARANYFRVQRADARIKRLLMGALYPYLERYTDIWATPARYYQPFAQERLQAGYSLTGEPAYKAINVTASSSSQGGNPHTPYETDPGDAYDGSVFTAWISENPPGPRAPQWIQVDLEEVIGAKAIRVGWLPDFEPHEIEVWTSVDGSAFSKATVRWDDHPAPVPFAESWSEGRFKFEKLLRSIRLEFRARGAQQVSTTPVGITEMEFGKPPDRSTVQRIKPLEVWLYALTPDFPSLYADAHPIEARLIPWVCWGHSVQGFVYHGLNDWPRAWQQLAGEIPRVWTNGGGGGDYLFYPGPDGPLPSVRAERLRDGLEDYEYLRAVQEAIDSEELTDKTLKAHCAPRVFGTAPSRETLDMWLETIPKSRVTMGRALGDLARDRDS